jgi:hypothetical protein
MKNLGLKLATWILSRLVRSSDREALIGDLAEEYARRTRAGPPHAAFGWYLRQTCASFPPLLSARLTQAMWPMTFGVALVAYLMVGGAQLLIQWAVRNMTTGAHAPLVLAILFPVILLIGYLAERLRRSAAIVLGTMLLLAIAAMTVWNTGSSPLPYRLAYLLVGPTVAFVGIAMDWRRRSAR